MRAVFQKYPRLMPLCLVVLFLVAGTAHAETTPSLTDPTTWWDWLMSRISVPGG